MKTQETIRLQSVGHAPAFPASEMREGDIRMYNFGSTSLVIKIIEKTDKTLTVITYDIQNKSYWMDDIRKTTLVAIVKRDQDISEHKPTQAYNVGGRNKGMVDVSEYFKMQQQKSGTIAINEDKINMNTLIFEGAGWEGAESSIKSGVGNCRIRTRIRNNDGRVIYLEMGGMLKQDPYHHNGYRSAGRVDHCFYADSKWDSNRSYSESLREVEGWRNFEYSKESILKFVNENLNCSFESMEVINNRSVRVHDTTEPLCDSSNGDSEQYKDVEVNIRVASCLIQYRAGSQ